MLLTLHCLGWAGVEENRLERARSALPGITSRYQELVDQTVTITGEAQLENLGAELWRAASGADDDRPLYWARLAIHDLARVRLGDSANLEGFERASRGMTEVDFSDQADWRVLISGFDPFHLDRDISQSNPSGLSALQLDGVRLRTERGTALVQAVVMPVRFADFDQGIVESFFGPWLRSG